METAAPSTEQPEVRVTWVDDRHLRAECDLAEGTLVMTTGFPEPVLLDERAEKEARVTSYILTADRDAMKVGQSNRYRRLGNTLVSLITGPPVWWLPRVIVQRSSDDHAHPSRTLIVGWLRAGIAFSRFSREAA